MSAGDEPCSPAGCGWWHWAVLGWELWCLCRPEPQWGKLHLQSLPALGGVCLTWGFAMARGSWEACGRVCAWGELRDLRLELRGDFRKRTLGFSQSTKESVFSGVGIEQEMRDAAGEAAAAVDANSAPLLREKSKLLPFACCIPFSQCPVLPPLLCR